MPKLRAPMALTLAAVMAAAIAVPAAAQDEPAPSIEGPVWELVAIGEAAADTSASMALDDGTAAIFGGCNSFFGAYTLDGQSLTFDENLTSTLVECEPEVMEQEQSYIAALSGVASYALEGPNLDLLDAGGGQALSFQEASVATTTDIDTLQFEIEKMRASLEHLRGRVHNEDVRPEVKALEAHLNKLSQQAISQRQRLTQHRQRIHSLEIAVAQLQTLLVEEGIMPID